MVKYNKKTTYIRSVSYTHLDVYKRQAPLSSEIMDNLQLTQLAESKYILQGDSIQQINQKIVKLLQQGNELKSFKEVLPSFNELFIKIVNQSNHE